ncbi:SAGA-associated factor 11 [Plasmodiophora brassicae]
MDDHDDAVLKAQDDEIRRLRHEIARVDASLVGLGLENGSGNRLGELLFDNSADTAWHDEKTLLDLSSFAGRPWPSLQSRLPPSASCRKGTPFQHRTTRHWRRLTLVNCTHCSRVMSATAFLGHLDVCSPASAKLIDDEAMQQHGAGTRDAPGPATTTTGGAADAGKRLASYRLGQRLPPDAAYPLRNLAIVFTRKLKHQCIPRPGDNYMRKVNRKRAFVRDLLMMQRPVPPGQNPAKMLRAMRRVPMAATSGPARSSVAPSTPGGGSYTTTSDCLARAVDDTGRCCRAGDPVGVAAARPSSNMTPQALAAARQAMMNSQKAAAAAAAATAATAVPSSSNPAGDARLQQQQQQMLFAQQHKNMLQMQQQAKGAPYVEAHLMQKNGVPMVATPSSRPPAMAASVQPQAKPPRKSKPKVSKKAAAAAGGGAAPALASTGATSTVRPPGPAQQQQVPVMHATPSAAATAALISNGNGSVPMPALAGRPPPIDKLRQVNMTAAEKLNLLLTTSDLTVLELGSEPTLPSTKPSVLNTAPRPS